MSDSANPLFGKLHAIRSRKQFAEVCRRLHSFICNKAHPSTAKAAMQIIMFDNISDVDTLRALRAVCTAARVSRAAYDSRKCARLHANTPPATRATSRIRDFTIELGIVAASFPINGRYLDIGCSEGAITKTIAIELQLSPAQAIACDAVAQPADDVFTFIHTNGTSIPLESCSVDAATMFMSAHHFAKPGTMFQEAFRVMRPGGLLLLREHDCINATAALFYDIIHALYSCVLSDEVTPEDFTAQYGTGTYAAYCNKHTWLTFATQHGFTLHPDVEPHGPVVRGAYGNDRYNSFYALFVRAPSAP
jgi:SAM-dependent methyltransferase